MPWAYIVTMLAAFLFAVGIGILGEGVLPISSE